MARHKTMTLLILGLGKFRFDLICSYIPKPNTEQLGDEQPQRGFVGEGSIKG